MRVMNKNIWPFQTKIQMVSSEDMFRWCQEKLYHGGYYEPNWYYNSDTNTWCFKDEKEFTMFCLRWAS